MINKNLVFISGKKHVGDCQSEILKCLQHQESVQKSAKCLLLMVILPPLYTLPKTFYWLNIHMVVNQETMKTCIQPPLYNSAFSEADVLNKPVELSKTITQQTTKHNDL